MTRLRATHARVYERVRVRVCVYERVRVRMRACSRVAAATVAASCG
jgi:hypothetical protein